MAMTSVTAQETAPLYSEENEKNHACRLEALRKYR